jgi:hypothetical protein
MKINNRNFKNVTGELTSTSRKVSRATQILGAIRSKEILADANAALGRHGTINPVRNEHYTYLILIIQLWERILRPSQMWGVQTALR